MSSEAGGDRNPVLVSVIVPARNAAATFGGTLDAVESQTLSGERYEALVVDDRSSDGTRELLRACGSPALPSMAGYLAGRIGALRSARARAEPLAHS